VNFIFVDEIVVILVLVWGERRIENYDCIAELDVPQRYYINALRGPCMLHGLEDVTNAMAALNSTFLRRWAMLAGCGRD
jgi:hypothetical protein